MISEAPIASAVADLPVADPTDPFAREQAALRAGGAPAVRGIGETLLDPELIAPDETSITLSAARDGRPAVVVLYRGAWCPFCNIALRIYRDDLRGPLAGRGVELVALSPQSPDGSMSMQEKNDLDFVVLSDPGNRIARALGVLTSPSADAQSAQREMGLDLAEVNADGTTDVPMPTVAIVDAEGTLVWAEVHPDYTTRTEPATILAALDELGL